WATKVAVACRRSNRRPGTQPVDCVPPSTPRYLNSSMRHRIPPRRPPPSGGGGIGPLRSRTGTDGSPPGEPASKNILAAGLAERLNACGAGVRPQGLKPGGRPAVKQETQPVRVGIPSLQGGEEVNR